MVKNVIIFVGDGMDWKMAGVRRLHTAYATGIALFARMNAILADPISLSTGI